MINLYYTQASGSVSSSILVRSDNNSVLPSSYDDVTLEITASGYETSGSTYTSTLGTLRVYIKSGSVTYASFPIEETNIYYSVPFTFSPVISNFSSSVFIDASISSFTTTSLNNFEITNLVSSSFSSSQFTTTFISGSTYQIKVSGSGLFFSGLSIVGSVCNAIIK